jgi:tetratricopeptide (TPR) repeat protein
MDPPAAAGEIAGGWHRTQAIDANNSIWELLGMPDRSRAENEELLRRAYAAAYHWSRADGSGPENEARALYMIGRAQLAVGHGELALEYGDECLAQCNEFGLVDFDLAYAHELRARGLYAVGRTDEAAAELAKARDVPIADADDRQVLDADLAVPLA